MHYELKHYQKIGQIEQAALFVDMLLRHISSTKIPQKEIIGFTNALDTATQELIRLVGNATQERGLHQENAADVSQLVLFLLGHERAPLPKLPNAMFPDPTDVEEVRCQVWKGQLDE